MTSEDPKTLWALRLPRSSALHGLWALLKILLVIAAIMVAMAAIQVKLCHDDYPHKTVLECIRS